MPLNKQWDALLALADDRAAASAFDADARLARGLALQRLHRTPAAHLAFDSALAIMDEDESAYLFRIDRLLPTTANVLTGKRGIDKQALAAISPAERATMSALFWALNDPLSATAENEARSEFMARVVQAEWQWSDAAQGLRGVDTDRGDIFVRYGPPDEEMTVPGSASVQQGFDANFVTNGGMMSTSQEGGSTLAWLYRSGEAFFFELAPGFGTARTPLTDQKYVADLASVKPAGWDNLAAPRRVDTLSVRTARFRAAGDSTDVVIVTRIPLRKLAVDSTRSSDAVDGTVRVDLTVVDGAARTVSRDSSRTTVSPDSLANGGLRSWVRRVGAGAAFMRVEAVHTSAKTDAQRSANAVAAVEAERARGFGISDVLLVRVGGAPPAASAARWNELGVIPSAGEYRVGEKLGLAWETYELAPPRTPIVTGRHHRRTREAFGSDRPRPSRSRNVGGLVKQEKGSADKLSVSFDRNVAAKPTQVEYLSLDWLGDARGEYRLKIEVTDLVTNRAVSRETRFRIQ